VLQDENVGVTTNPVTQVDVVEVKSASKKGFASPSAELIGKESNTEPIIIATKKLNNIICVVDIEIRCFFISVYMLKNLTVFKLLYRSYVLCRSFDIIKHIAKIICQKIQFFAICPDKILFNSLLHSVT